MGFTEANKKEIIDFMGPLRKKYPWLGVFVYDAKKVNSKQELIDHINEKLEWPPSDP